MALRKKLVTFTESVSSFATRNVVLDHQRICW